MSVSKNHLPQALLKLLLDYNPETGEVVWKIPYGKNKIGDQVGFHVPQKNKQRSALYFYYGGHLRSVAATIWVWMTGEFPEVEIDHENRDNIDNRWVNLREATRSQNQTNTGLYKNNKCGHRGVHRHQGRWRAMISVDGKNKHIGYFNSESEAASAWESEARSHRGDFAFTECVARLP